MNRVIALAMGCAFLSFLPRVAAAQSGQPTPNQKNNCTAQNWSDHDRVNYAESREEILPQTLLNTINSGTNGGISVHGWDQNNVRVVACIHTAAASDAEARGLASQIRITQGPGRIEPLGPTNSDRNSWSVSYQVWVPKQSNLNISAHNGGLNLEDVTGQVEFRTVNGGVNLARIGGDITGSTQNGGVHVVLEGSRWNGAGLHVKTTNGGVRLVLPSNYSAHLQVSTVNGGVHNDFASPGDDRHSKSLSFEVGGGGATVEATTVNGGLSISRS